MGDLLATKLYIPCNDRELIARPRLIQRLQTGLPRKLTLVSAPAGYGKTVLISSWIDRFDMPVAWLSLDAADSEFSRFFSYLIAALQQIEPGICSGIRPMLETESEPSAANMLTSLVNDVASFHTDITLVLDGYHVIHDLRIHDAIEFLLDYLPSHMHLVIITRADPPMPLARLCVQRQMTEVREADLRFTLDETAAFLNDLVGLELSAEEIESLHARTEGWIAGLQLIAVTLGDCCDRQEQISAITGSHRHLIDYLVHEVLSRRRKIFGLFFSGHRY